MFSMTSVWVVVALLMLGAEFLTSGFLLIFFALGGAMAAVVAFLGWSIGWQMGIFALGSLFFMAVGRPFLLRFFRIDKEVKASTADAMVGLRGVVVKLITPLEFGQVRVQGDIWTAGCVDQCELPEGSQVEVARVDGVKLLVKAVDNS